MKKTMVAVLMMIAGLNYTEAQVKTSPAAPAKPVLKTGIDSFSYAIGVNVANSLKEQGITTINTKAMAQAIDEILAGKNTILTKEQCDMTLQQKLQEYSRKKSEGEKARAAAFLAENKKRKEVKSLPNGLQYEVIKSGDAAGPMPKAVDKVVVHYTGTLIDGTVFDSSVKRGEPITFPLNGVIRGWTEILQLMHKGDQWKVYIPSDLGYGDNGAPPSIPPGATLIFDIQLLDIQPAESK